jgi:hypothetical protein
LSGSNAARVAQALERGATGGRNGSRLLEGDVRRLGAKHAIAAYAALLPARADVHSAKAPRHVPKDLIARLKLRHILADSRDRLGNISPDDTGLWRAQSKAHQANEVRATGHEMPHIWTDASGVDAYQDLVVPDGRLFDLLERQHVGRAIPLLGHRLHESILTAGSGLPLAGQPSADHVSGGARLGPVSAEAGHIASRASPRSRFQRAR